VLVLLSKNTMDNLENINEEYLRMQKMAGIITEAEYKHSVAQLWYKEYANNLGVLLDKLKITIENERKND